MRTSLVAAVVNADLVVECIPENLPLKRSIFRGATKPGRAEEREEEEKSIDKSLELKYCLCAKARTSRGNRRRKKKHRQKILSGNTICVVLVLLAVCVSSLHSQHLPHRNWRGCARLDAVDLQHDELQHLRDCTGQPSGEGECTTTPLIPFRSLILHTLSL